MNLNELTERDLDTLIEAMDAWEKQPSDTGFAKSLFGAMLGGIGPEETRERRLAESEARIKADVAKAENDCKARKRISTILRAKLEIARMALQESAISTAAGVEQ